MKFAGVTVQRNVPCTMRDGVVLYADIYRPDVSPYKPLPVLIMRQPYGKTLASTVTYAHPTWFARHGYMVVIQDVRGRGESEGKFHPFVQEIEDGYVTVEWAANLPGSNGRVGMYGFSYQGFTQWAAVASRPPHLRAVAPAMTAADLYHGWFYPHGRFSIGFHLPWAAQLARDEARRIGQPEMEERLSEIMRDCRRLLYHLPLRDIPELYELAPYYQEWIEHFEYDTYWAERDLISALQEYCVPTFQIAGWYDPYLMGDWQVYSMLSKAHANHIDQHQLLIGPWGHIPWGRYAGGVDHGEAALDSIHFHLLNWFDKWLKSNDSGDRLDEARIHDFVVRYFERGSNKWLEEYPANSSPLGPTSELVLYLSSNGAPSNGLNGGGRLDYSPSSAGIDVFVYDARLPMPCESYLPEDRRVIQERFEILVYTSPPFREPVRIAGVPRLKIWVNAIPRMTDIVAILTHVSPSGEAKFLTIGRALLDSGDIADEWSEIEIEMRPIAIYCDSGSSIRLEITGSSFPLFVRHPNGTDERGVINADVSNLKMATVAITYGCQYPSMLLLPIKEAETFRRH